MSEYLVEVKDLKQYFPIKVGFTKTIPLKAVDGVSFSIKPGETLGLVGESGCGKTTVGRSLLRLYTPTGGEVLYNGEKVDGSSIKHMRKEMQMVFQDPYSSLNPRMTVEDIIGEPLDVHKLYSNKAERREKIINLMELVGLNAEHATRYAHEFSGGQRQRIGIARALATNPKFIVCDEAVSALDVSIQAQVINMFEELQEKLGVAYLFIAHDLLVQGAQGIDKGAHLSPERDDPQADFVAHQNHRPGGLPKRFQKHSCLRLPVKRQGLFLFKFHGFYTQRHRPVREPQREAVHHHQGLRRAVPLDGSGHVVRLLHRLQARHAHGAVALVARDALAHLVVPSLARGDEHGAVVRRLREPVARQQLGAARFAAFLAAEDELATGDARVRSGAARVHRQNV